MPRKPRAPVTWRAPFLQRLREGRSYTQAAHAAGIDPSAAHAARRRDAGFAAACHQARTEGAARVTAAAASVLAPDEVVRGSKDGRPRIQRAGPGRWSAAKEAVFLETLATTANVSAACRAAGVSNVTVYARRERWPDFRAGWESALAHGCARLDMLLVGTAIATLEGAPAEPGGFVAPMTVAEAITVRRMHDHAVTGEGRRPRHDWRRPVMSVEEVRAEVMRRVRAIGVLASGNQAPPTSRSETVPTPPIFNLDEPEQPPLGEVTSSAD